MREHNVFQTVHMSDAEYRRRNLNPLRIVWVYSLKASQADLGRHEPTNDAGLILRARAAAQGFRQREGIDFLETYSPCMRPTTLRSLEAAAVKNKWASGTGDVSAAFFMSDQQIVQYIVPLEGPTRAANGDYILYECHKTVPGQRDGSRNWYECLRKALLKLGYKQCIADPCLFKRGDHNTGEFTYLAAHVDDISGYADGKATLKASFEEIRKIFPFDYALRISKFMGINFTDLPDGGRAYDSTISSTTCWLITNVTSTKTLCCTPNRSRSASAPRSRQRTSSATRRHAPRWTPFHTHRPSAAWALSRSTRVPTSAKRSASFRAFSRPTLAK